MHQRYSVLALPHSHRADEAFHLSLFVSPDLQAAPGEDLSASTVFRDWAAGLATATIEVTCDSGELPIEPLTSPIRADLWQHLFPGSTPVRTYEPPQWDGRHWRTFEARAGQDAALAIQTALAAASPVAPPDVDAGAALADALGLGYGRFDNSDELEASRLRRWDEVTGELSLDHPVPLARLEGRGGRGDPNERLLWQLHRARRFYDRPEEQHDYRRRPDPDATQPPLPRPEPDFAERLSLINDHPALQRLLGIVIDCRVLELDRLRAASWLSARILPADGDGECVSPRTAIRVAGDALVAAPAGEEWSDGALRLADESRFDVLLVDPDGTALKTEQYLGGLARTLDDMASGGTSTAAPPAVRTSGFTIARRGNGQATQGAMDRQKALLGDLRDGADAQLSLEDVTVGVRVEVFDETRGRWFSLHSCDVRARVQATGEELTFSEEGFVQETAPTLNAARPNGPVHVHESLFGWDGWSLSAPRPGRRIRHEAGAEIVEDVPDEDDPVLGLSIRTSATPHTLPRLRYGRSYAFRAWAVDLAGNSRPHPLNPEAVPAELVDAARQLTRRPLEPTLPDLSGVAAASAAAASPPRPGRLTVSRPLREALLSQASVQAGAGARAARGASLREVAAHGFRSALQDAQPALTAGPRTLSAGAVSTLAALLGASHVDEIADAVSDLVPHLRWDPVLPPTLVPRWEFSEGESNQRLVLRSWVTQAHPGADVHLDEPAVYAARRPGRHSSAERHLVPPRASQFESEQLGAFDEAVGSDDASAHTKWLAAAVHESGTLFDVAVAGWTDLGTSSPQPGIALVHGPGTPAAELATLPLPAGEPPAAGQYVVHDTDALRLPYLCDLLARGVNLLFDAGHDRLLPTPHALESFSAHYRGSWPAVEPIRLQAVAGPDLDGSLEDGVLTLAVPAGTELGFGLSSRIDADGLALLGPWRNLGPAVAAQPALVAAALAGWLWLLTPSHPVTIVHAVNRPVRAPDPWAFEVTRTSLGQTSAAVEALIGVHGPSTESLAVEGRWSEWVDDPSQPAPERQSRSAVAGTTSVETWETAALTGAHEKDETVEEYPFGRVRQHRLVHDFGDTRHREVTYTVRASTRFREYFAPDELAPAPADDPPAADAPGDDGRSTLSRPIVVHVPNSTIPAPPVVHSVLPLQRWIDGDEPAQPFGRRRSRFAGVRIYLERPWYVTGDGELVGLVVGGPTGRTSEFGRDPIWVAPGEPGAMDLTLDHLRAVEGMPDHTADGGSATPPVDITVGGQRLEVVGYRPRYSADRGMWHVDIALDTTACLWPFVRFALTRFQPHSIDGAQVSEIVMSDFVQLLPERTTSLARTDEDSLRIVVSGPVGWHDAAWQHGADEGTAGWLAEQVSVNRSVLAKVQRRAVADSDVLWNDLQRIELTPVGYGTDATELSWVGTVDVPPELRVETPEGPWWCRVLVEEWERLPGDRERLGDPHSEVVWQTRLVYADEFELG